MKKLGLFLFLLFFLRTTSGSSDVLILRGHVPHTIKIERPSGYEKLILKVDARPKHLGIYEIPLEGHPSQSKIVVISHQ